MQTSTLVCRTTIFAVLLLAALPTDAAFAEEDGKSGDGWKTRLAKELPLLGHRNWIVVADAAYPAQTRSGIETIYVGGDHVEAIAAVLKLVDGAKHVQAAPLVDAELTAVAESDAPGINAFRAQLDRLLKDRPVRKTPHEEIIRQLDEAAGLFRVIVIKTDMSLPYTSLFLQLECGYWDADKEQRLRQSLERTR